MHSISLHHSYLYQKSSVNHPFDATSPRIKFLLSTHKFLKKDTMVILFGLKTISIHVVIFLMAFWASYLTSNTFFCKQVEKIEKLRLYCRLNDGGNGFILEAMFLMDLLKDRVDNISEDFGKRDVFVEIFELSSKVRLPYVRKWVDYLSHSDHDIWLNYDQRGPADFPYPLPISFRVLRELLILFIHPRQARTCCLWRNLQLFQI